MVLTRTLFSPHAHCKIYRTSHSSAYDDELMCYSWSHQHLMFNELEVIYELIALKLIKAKFH